ncbi:MAG: peptidoglycan DD-metalloendopeptidase family protein [Burkholderiales bacterium]
MRSYTPLQRAAALLLFAATGTVAAIAAITPDTDAALLIGKASLPEPVAISADSVLPSPTTFRREERFLAGDTVAGLLGRLAVSTSETQKFLRLREARLLRPGTIVTAEVRAGSEHGGDLVWLNFLASRDTMLRVEHVGARLVATEEHAQIVTRAERKAAVIRSSLFSATDAAGIPDAVAIQLADVFAGEIDFHRELRKGDRLAVVYEMRSIDGRPLRAGRVLAAEFTNQGKTYRAVWYGTGYFSPDGKNLRKALLRSPLELSRVSSGFGLRMHPFLQSWRAHQGVDYAAPIGTHVRAVGDGIVEFAGRQHGYGNVVIIRHDSRVSTYYAHLSGFGRNVRAGARVSQGEVIGSVGQTGWATGPHLHYEIRVAGAARNPLSVTLPDGAPVAAHDLAAFRAHAQPLVAQLDMLGAGQLASLENFAE